MAAAIAGGLALVGFCECAKAQASQTTQTQAASDTIIFNNPVVTTTTTQLFETQIIGRIQGGAPLFDQTFNAAFADPIVQGGVTAARLAITNAGGPGVIVGAPVLTATITTTTSTSASTFVLAGQTQTLAFELTVGPGSVLIGDLGRCPAVLALPGPVRPTCNAANPVNFVVPFGSQNLNTTVETVYTVDELVLIEQNTTLFEQYTLTGVVRRLGSIHGVAPTGTFEQGERFSRRLLDAAASEDNAFMSPAFGGLPPAARSFAPVGSGSGGPLASFPGAGPASPSPSWNAWFDVYGWHGRRSASGGLAGDKRNGVGVNGGFGFQVTEQLRVGFGVDHGVVDLDLDGVGEKARLNLTQIGVYAGWRNGPWVLAASAQAGFGDVDTTIAPAGLNFSSIGSYSAKLFSAAGEFGYRIEGGDWRLTPHIGGQWMNAQMGAFAETGAFALTSPGGDFDWGKGWIGFSGDYRADLGALPLTLKGHVRAVAYSNDEILLPAGFAGIAVPMTINGPRAGDFGAEMGLGAQLRLSANASVFAGYDVRLRARMHTHAGTVGVRVIW